MLSFEELSELYRGDWAAARICDAGPDEMLRKGFEVRVANDVDTTLAVNRALDDLQALSKLHEASVWARVFGGSAILLGTDDEWSKEGGLRTPLQLDAVTSLEVLTVLDARELVPLFYYDSPFDPKYGQVRSYRAQPLFGTQSGESLHEIEALFEVHESRVVRFEGVHVVRRYVQQNLGWGDSVLQRCYDVIRDSGMNWSAASALIQDFSQGVFKMSGLADAVAGDQQGLVMGRLAAMDMARSALRSVVIDAEGEEFSRVTTPMSGLPETLDKFMLLLAATARMPVTVLMGQSPAGLNATGASDLRLWYDQCDSERRNKVEPALRRICEVLFHAKDGPTKGRVPAEWSICFPPLYQLTDLEEATRRKTIADTDVAYINAQVLRPEEVATSRYGGAEYSAETHLDTATRAAMAPEKPDPDARDARPSPAEERAGDPSEPAATGSATDPKAEATPADRGDGNEDQPRDENGRFASGGSGGEAMAELSGSQLGNVSKPLLMGRGRIRAIATKADTPAARAVTSKYPLKATRFQRSVEASDGAEANGKYIRAKGEVEVAVHRSADTWGKQLVPGAGTQIHELGDDLAPHIAGSISQSGKTNNDAAGMTLSHEIGHHLHVLADKATAGAFMDEVADHFYRMPGEEGAARPITRYAARDHENYFAECFAAHEHYPEKLRDHDPVGHALVQKALKIVGVRHG